MFHSQVSSLPIIVGSTPLEIIKEYVYLDKTIELGRSNFEAEVTH